MTNKKVTTQNEAIITSPQPQWHIYKYATIYLIILITLTSCISNIQIDKSKELSPPKDAYYYYSGTKKIAGNLYCKSQQFTHPKTHKKITLLAMIHIADQQFYQQVQHELDQANLVLNEGVASKPSIGIQHFFLSYILANYQRIADLQAIGQQSEYMYQRANWKNGDVTKTTFAKSSTWKSNIIQLLATPIIIILTETLTINGETYLLIKKLQKQKKLAYAKFRHLQLMTMTQEISNKKNKKLINLMLPGILNLRNQHLIKQIDKNIKKKYINHIIVPWGAEHHQGLEKMLLERGYKKTAHHWLVATAVKDLINDKVKYNQTRKFYIPYLASYHKYPHSKHASILCQLIKFDKIYNRYTTLDIGYQQLFTVQHGPNHTAFSILPYLFGKPLLLDYQNIKNKKQLRFLYFFKITTKKQKNTRKKNNHKK